MQQNLLQKIEESINNSRRDSTISIVNDKLTLSVFELLRKSLSKVSEINLILRDTLASLPQDQLVREFELNPSEALFNAYDITQKNKRQRGDGVVKQSTTAEEEQMVIRAFTGLMDTMPDEPEKSPRPLPDDEIERVTRYIEVKSMSVAFRNDVETALKDARFKFKRDYRNDPFICDFMLELRGRRLAIDCKYNINRDWDRTYATVKLLRENLPCEKVVIVVPYENQAVRNSTVEVEEQDGMVCDLSNLIATLKCILEEL